MAFVALPQVLQDALKALRTGTNPTGAVGTALVSDLQAEDFLWGARARVVSTGATTSGVRQVTLERRGEVQYTVGMVATSSLWIIR